MDDTAGGRRGPAGPAARPEERAAVVDDRVARGNGARGGRPVPPGSRRVGHAEDVRVLPGRSPAVARTGVLVVRRRPAAGPRALHGRGRRRRAHAARRAVAGRQAPLWPGGVVDGGGLLEGLLPAPVVPRGQHGAGRGAWPDEAADAGGPQPVLPGAREEGDAGEPAGAEGAAPAAPEDAPGRRPGRAAVRGELREGPAGGDLAGRRGPADRGTV